MASGDSWASSDIDIDNQNGSKNVQSVTDLFSKRKILYAIF